MWGKGWQHLIRSMRRAEVILLNLYIEFGFPYVTKMLTKDFQNQSYHAWTNCVVFFIYTYVHCIFVYTEIEGKQKPGKFKESGHARS